MCVCVCVPASARARVCVCLWVHVCVCVCRGGGADVFRCVGVLSTFFFKAGLHGNNSTLMS